MKITKNGIVGLLGLWVIFSLFTAGAAAEVPRQLSYSGFLSDAVGKPMVGAHSITFRLYDNPSAGRELWEETHEIDVQKGIFQVVLGTRKSLDVVFDRPLWLSLEVNQEGEMNPRLPLVSVGYALNAASLDSVPATQFLRTDRGGEVQGSLAINGVLMVEGKPVMKWDQRSVLMVGLTSFASGALGGVLVFTLARFMASRKH
ncbi:MAG: hypothetical protein HYS56_01855 [Candidatus Omnitrophica bacterium]|nr:hypothetical protein [Candidatus Omnitrophota bacterium]